MAQVSKFLTTLSLFTTSVYSHSWLHCSDYSSPETLNGDGTFDDANCNGYIRAWQSQWGGTAFGTDRGVNYQPNGDWCQAGSGYDGGFPMASWDYGETVTLVWPAKNHANYECTDNIPDNSMKLYYRNQPGQTEPNYNAGVGNPTGDGWSLLIDWQQGCTPEDNGCGFQNCPNYCAGTDKAPCFQQYMVSQNDFASAGTYTLMWYWEFNAGSYYTTCFEVQITGDTSSGNGGGDNGGGNNGGDSSDSGNNNNNVETFDDYIIQIPVNVSDVAYNKDTLISGANKIEVTDTTVDFFVLQERKTNTMDWYVVLQSSTNRPGNIFTAAYDYTSNPQGYSDLCNKILAEFGAGSCIVEPGLIQIYGEATGGSSANTIYFNTLLFFSIGLIAFLAN